MGGTTVKLDSTRTGNEKGTGDQRRITVVKKGKGKDMSIRKHVEDTKSVLSVGMCRAG